LIFGRPAQLYAELPDDRPIADTAMGAVVSREVPFSSIKASEWDAFAAACECSVRSTRAQLWAWALKHMFSHRLRTFELFKQTATGDEKIAQCAVGVGRSQVSVFLDRLQILPKDEALWRPAMRALLAELGAGTFRYGLELNLEPRRDEDLLAIPLVRI